MTSASTRYRWRNTARMSSTLDRDALAKAFSRRMRSRFPGTVAFTSQCESSVFVSSSKALALMIFDVYGGGTDAETPFFLAFRTAMLAPASWLCSHGAIAGSGTVARERAGVNGVDIQLQ